MEYRLVQHHIDTLTKNAVVRSEGERYGRMYFLNPWVESHFEIFEEIISKLKFKLQ